MLRTYTVTRQPFPATFDAYKARVDATVQNIAGLSIDDLTDCPLRDWYEDRVSPASAAKRALRNADFYDD